jgi:hypothetical protein
MRTKHMHYSSGLYSTQETKNRLLFEYRREVLAVAF